MEIEKKQLIGKARLADVAAMVGVSIVTASKVLTNNSGNNTRVSVETRRRITEAAQQIGYRPSIAAKMLVGKDTKTIGILLDVNSPPEHFMRVSRMQEEAEKHGYWLIIGECRANMSNIANFISDFVSRGVDGFISIAHVHRDIGSQVIELFRQVGKPVVYYDMPPELLQPELACVYVDFAAGISRATEYLYELGRQRISFLMPWINYEHGIYHFVTERERGFVQVMRKYGLKYDLEFNYRNNIWGSDLVCEKVFPVIARLLEEQQPDAVIAGNDSFASLVLSYCHRNNLVVPADLAVIGFDNLEFSGFVYPSLTTLDPHTAEASQTAVSLLLDMIRTGKMPEKHQYAFVPELIIRESAK